MRQVLILRASTPLPFDESWDTGRYRDLWFYRERTQGILQRFFVMSMETGRVPSILGREFFRSRVTSYSASSFEDVVIFVHDVERCLERLDPLSRELIGRIVLQGFSQDEVARRLGCCRATINRSFPDALDRLSEIFLSVGILKHVEPPPRPADENACQEGENDEMTLIM